MLNVYRVFMIVVMVSFSCACKAKISDKDKIDNMILDSTIAIADKEFDVAVSILEELSLKESEMTVSQKMNILYGLLELSYITKKTEQADLYGHKLIKLFGDNSDYSEMKTRLLFRLCESEDWSSNRKLFDDICIKQ